MLMFGRNQINSAKESSFNENKFEIRKKKKEYRRKSLMGNEIGGKGQDTTTRY